LRRRVHLLRQQSLLHLDQLLGPFLPPGLLSQADEGSNSRDRIYNVRRTFFGFVYQVLNPHCPCRAIVRQIQALFALQLGRSVNEGTGGWCQARARLPWDRLARLRCAAAAHAEKAAQLWHGWRVKVIDGTSTSLPDTAQNQRAYPQPGGQQPGCGFPLLKIVGVFSLASGALLDAQAYPAEELARLYVRRWRIELWFRDIKTSMGMELLRCKSPQMAHKELEMFFIAYNLIRALMAAAGAIDDVPLERLSFKGTVDSVRQFSVAIAQARSRKQQKQLITHLLEIIARDQVPDRPGRREPRAVKRRPKPFPLLNQPREQFQEIPHRNRYWKNNPRKSYA